MCAEAVTDITEQITHPDTAAFQMIPASWYKKLTNKWGLQYTLAIAILSDLFCNHPNVHLSVNEDYGLMTGYIQEYESNELFVPYEAFACKYGVSKRQVKAAMDYLEEKGLIRRTFRTIEFNSEESGSQKVSNAMFTVLDLKAIEQISRDISAKGV